MGCRVLKKKQSKNPFDRDKLGEVFRMTPELPLMWFLEGLRNQQSLRRKWFVIKATLQGP